MSAPAPPPAAVVFVPEQGEESSGSAAPWLIGGGVVLLIGAFVAVELLFGVFGLFGAGKEAAADAAAPPPADAAAAPAAAPPPPPPPAGGTARFVRIEAGLDQMLNVTEIEVFDEAQALIPAAEIVPTLSPQYGDPVSFGPQHLTDGLKTSKADANGPWKLPHTGSSAQAFMQLDLGRMRQVTRVVVHNRDDCCKDRITGAKLVLRDAANAVVCESTFMGQADVYTMVVSAEACSLTANA